MNKEQNQFEVLSPDGFPISATETYATPEAAQTALTNWIKRYEAQGYYRDNNWNQIPINEIESYCKIVPLVVS